MFHATQRIDERTALLSFTLRRYCMGLFQPVQPPGIRRRRTSPASAAPCASSRSPRTSRAGSRRGSASSSGGPGQARAEAAAAASRTWPPPGRACRPAEAPAGKLADMQARLAQAEQARAAARSRSRR